MEIAIIIVLYQKKIDSSSAFKSIVNQEVDVIFFDNSTLVDIIKFNEVYAMENSIKYYSLNSNVGLAKAYNFVISKEKYDFYITSDYDTEYPKNYIDMFLSDYTDETLVFFPKIEGINGEKYKKLVYRNKYILQVIPLRLKDKGYYRFINSGTFYNSVVFEKLKFNEQLLVEYVDYDMCDKLKRNKIMQKELDITLVQKFSTFIERCDRNSGRLYYTYNDKLIYYGFFAYFNELLNHTIAAIKNRNLDVFISYWEIYIKGKNKGKL